MQQLLPGKLEIYDMLGILLGDNLTVEYRKLPTTFEKTFAAIYVDAAGNPGALCLCDIPFAAYAGGALTMMPPNSTEYAVEDEELTPVLTQNLYEIMNICTRLVINDDTPHLRLTKVVEAQEIEDTIEQFLALGNRGDYDLNIPRYGKGTLTFLVR